MMYKKTFGEDQEALGVQEAEQVHAQAIEKLRKSSAYFLAYLDEDGQVGSIGGVIRMTEVPVILAFLAATADMATRSLLEALEGLE